jgi:hypothetical protein
VLGDVPTEDLIKELKRRHRDLGMLIVRNVRGGALSADWAVHVIGPWEQQLKLMNCLQWTLQETWRETTFTHEEEDDSDGFLPQEDND